MRIIFLDIDGVLNNRKSLMRQAELKTLWLMDEDCVDRLNRIVDLTSAEIVISSSWRHGLQLTEIQEVLAKHGFRFTARVIDHTPRRINNEQIIKQATKGIGLKLSMSIPRAWEILEWLHGNQERTESFVILDDDHPFSPEQMNNAPDVINRMMKRFVRTNHELGLLNDDAEKAIEILRDKIEKPFHA